MALESQTGQANNTEAQATEQGDALVKKKTLTLGKRLEVKRPAEGQVQQSFTHGRTKTVDVEVKRKKIGSQVEKPIEPVNVNEANLPETLRGLTHGELDARLKAVKSALEEQARQQERRSRNQEPEESAKDSEILEQKRIELVSLELMAATLPPAPGELVKTPQRSDSKHPAKPKDDFVVADDEEAVAAKRKAVVYRAEAPKKVVVPAKKTLSEAPKKLDRNTQARLLADDTEQRSRSIAAMKRMNQKKMRQQHGADQQDAQKIVREVIIPETIVVGELANRMAVRSGDVVKSLMKLGMMVTINQIIDADTAELICAEFGHTPKRVSDSDIEIGLKGAEDNAADLVSRAPIVTVMGHVDHGKTSLLDALRKTDVVAGEAGGITQHIGAYQVTMASGKKITFIDTPGHAAFSEMRARGANVTDVVVLVVAADDGIMEQTIEAINHAKAAGVPIVVAINKIDKPDANPERVRSELLSHDIILEEFGGDVLSVEVSAKELRNLEKLEEVILLQAEVIEPKANPNRSALGAVVEAKVDRGRGTVVTLLVQNGTLEVGDIVVAGSEWGKVRAMVNDHGKPIKQAGPSVPVEVLGFNGVPTAGHEFLVVESEAKAREIAESRTHRKRDQIAKSRVKTSMESIMSQIAAGDIKEFPVVIKTDVQGSLEAITSSLQKLSGTEVAPRILHGGVGGINESDVTLARASGGIIVGFNVRANPQARDLARRDGLDIRYYSIIYDVIDDIKTMLSGLLAPTLKEKYLGNAAIRNVFNITGIGKVAGCYITEGVVKRGAKVRLLRDSIVIHEGTLKTLKRFKDEVKEVKEAFECGMAFENYNDIREGDIIECFEIESIARKL
ncbi:MAG: translation initiation factor IF-2 [Alphaproteobacteria bacterium]|jgi:translation initiation factor IF-2